MQKVLSLTDYWDEFFKQFPDKKPFIDFISRDQSLLKIFNFVSIPDISDNIKKYPFGDKIRDMELISQKDKKHLFDLSIQWTDKTKKEGAWIDYIVNLYELINTTLRLYTLLKNETILSQNETLNFLEIHFRKHLAIDKTYTIEERKGVQKSFRIIGRVHHFRRLIFVEPDNILKVEFLIKPLENQIEYIKNQLDKMSVINFQRYRPLFDEICFGNYDPGKYLVEFYYKNEKLDGFIYPIRNRFKPLIRKKIKNLHGDDARSFADEKFFKSALSYDPAKGTFPAGWFKENFKYLGFEYYEKKSTKNLPGDPRLNCDQCCKEQKKYENKLPCEFETPEGYCENPARKGDSKFKWDVEHSAFSFDKDLEKIVEISPDQIEEDRNSIDKEIDFKKHVKKIRDVVCKDETDLKMLNCIFSGEGDFKDKDIDKKINYSEIARILGTYDNDIKRRWGKIKNRARKHRSLRNIFE